MNNCLNAAVLSGLSKADPELLVRLSGVLTIMIKMAEENVAVVKKLVLCMAQIYKSALLVSTSTSVVCVVLNRNFSFIKARMFTKSATRNWKKLQYMF